MNWKQRIRLLVRRRWSSNAVASSNVVAWLLLILLALFLRTYQIQNQYATRDECFSWRLIQYPLGEQVYRMALDVHPPLYYVLLTVWSKLGGLSMHWLRLMSVLISLATIPLVGSATRTTMAC